MNEPFLSSTTELTICTPRPTKVKVLSVVLNNIKHFLYLRVNILSSVLSVGVRTCSFDISQRPMRTTHFEFPHNTGLASKLCWQDGRGLRKVSGLHCYALSRPIRYSIQSVKQTYLNTNRLPRVISTSSLLGITLTSSKGRWFCTRPARLWHKASTSSEKRNEIR